MCDQQSLRPACAYAQSDQSLCSSLEYSMTVKLLTGHHLAFLSLKGGGRGSSKYHIVGNHMSRLIYVFFSADGMSSLSGQKFSTKDKDNDSWLNGECAKQRWSGWWHNICGGSSLNGQYFPYEERNNPGRGGIRWNIAEGPDYSFKFSKMKIKRA